MSGELVFTVSGATATAAEPIGLAQAGFKSTYTPSRLARHILTEAAGRTSSIQGPLCWITVDGRTLVDLADELRAKGEAPIASDV